MRESALVARLDEHGREVLVAHRPVIFSLDETASAMHAVVDPQLARLGASTRVGRGRVRDALREVAVRGWPATFTPDAGRIAHWRQWLLDQRIFTVGDPGVPVAHRSDSHPTPTSDDLDR